MSDAAKRAKAVVAARTKKTVKKTTAEVVKQASIICGVSMAVAFCLLYLSPPKGTYEIEVNNVARIEQINQISKVWTAGENKAFAGMTVGDVRDLGPVNFRNPEAQWHLCPPPGADAASYPEQFDVREQWPDCFPDHVYDQGNCSASYAIASASAVANRYCIQDPVNYKMFQLSPQSIVACDNGNDGCFGGGMDTVWTHLQETGITSEICHPFTGEGECGVACEDEEPVKIIQKCIAQNEEMVKQEVFANGPVVAPMRLTDELLLYKSGIFTPTRTAIPIGEKKQPKAKKTVMVKIMGWGTEDETPYWLVEGVFGKEWGDNGFAKIAIPEDEADASGQGGNPNAVIATEFTFVGVPANMRFGGAPDEFDDINFDEGSGDDVSFDDDVEFDDDAATADED
jgi:cathepsin B